MLELDLGFQSAGLGLGHGHEAVLRRAVLELGLGFQSAGLGLGLGLGHYKGSNT